MSELAPIVVIAGNHDDADRLAAPLTLAKRHGIYLVGGMDNTSFCRTVFAAAKVG